MLRRSFFVALAGGLALGVSACNEYRPTAPNGTTSGVTGATTVTAMPTDIGDPLYPAVQPKPRPAAATFTADPIILRNCQVTLPETQNAPSKNDGKLLAFCTEPEKGEVVPPDQQIIHPRTKKVYRKLREGDFVK